MDDIDHKSGHKSGHLMLITPERVFYAGLLGRPRARCSGAFNVYVAIEGGLWLTTADGRETYGGLAAVLPNVRHTIASDFRSVPRAKLSPTEFAPPMSPCASAKAATISAMPNSISCVLARPCRDARWIRGWRARSCRSENSAASR